MMLAQSHSIPESWQDELASEDHPYGIEIESILLFRQGRWQEVNELLTGLIADFPEAIDVFSSLGRRLLTDLWTFYPSNTIEREIGSGWRIEPTPEGENALRAREILLRLLHHAADHLGLTAAASRLIDVSFNPPNADELRRTIATCQALDQSEASAIAEVLLAYTERRFSDVGDICDKRVPADRMNPAFRSLRNDSRLRAGQWEALRRDLPEELKNPTAPRQFAPFIVGLKAEGDFEGAYRLALQVLSLFPDHRDALKLMLNATLGTERQEEGMVSLKRLTELYPEDSGFRTASVDDVVDLMATQREETDRQQRLYLECRLPLAFLPPSFLESWYRQRTLGTGVQALRSGLEGRSGRARDLSERTIVLDPGAVLAASRLKLWPELRRAHRILVHPLIRQGLAEEVQALRAGLGDRALRHAREVRRLLKHPKLRSSAFTEEEIATAENGSPAACERAAALLRGFTLVSSYDGSDSSGGVESVTLEEFIRAARADGRIPTAKFRELMSKIAEDGIRSERDDIKAPSMSVIFSDQDLSRLVEHNVAEDVLALVDEALVLPSTSFGLSLRIGRSLFIDEIVENASTALVDLESEIIEGYITEPALPLRPELDSREMVEEILSLAHLESALLWTDETMFRALAAGEYPLAVSGSTLEIVGWMRELEWIDDDMQAEWTRDLLADGHRNPVVAGSLAFAYWAGSGVDDPQFIGILQRFGWMLDPMSFRTEEEGQTTVTSVATLLFALQKTLGDNDLMIFAKTVETILSVTYTSGKRTNGQRLLNLLLVLIERLRPTWIDPLLDHLDGTADFRREHWYALQRRRAAKPGEDGTLKTLVRDAWLGTTLRVSRSALNSRATMRPF